MSSKSFYITIGLLMICLHQFLGTVNGLPYQLNLKKMFESVGELKTKKDVLTSFTPPDVDVIELEHLKRPDTTAFDNKSSDDDNNNESNPNVDGVGGGGDSDGTAGADADEGGNDEISIMSGSNIAAPMLSGNTDNVGKSAFQNAFDSPYEDAVQLENLPSLEKQLEAEADREKNVEQSATGQPEREEEMIVQHRPPHNPYPIQPPHLNAPNHLINQNGNEQSSSSSSTVDETVPAAPGKTYHGAARLAFGQRPEVLPTTSTTTTTTTAPATTELCDPINAEISELEKLTGEVSENVQPAVSVSSAESVVNSPVEVPVSASTSTVSVPQTTTTNNPNRDQIVLPNHPSHLGQKISEERLVPSDPVTITTTIKSIETEENKGTTELEAIIKEAEEEKQDDSIVAELEATKSNIQRRSVNRIPTKSAESLLRNAESSFDMAQYVFWTGDETGVARAVEEFIQQGLIKSSKGCSTDDPISELPIMVTDEIVSGEMSRESALKFLKEIRMGIEYLQKSYANRVVPDQKSNMYKKHDHSSTIKIPLNIAVETGSGLSDSMDITSMPSKHDNVNLQLEQQLQKHLEEQGIIEQENNLQSNSLNLQKTLDHLPSLMRLQDARSVSSNSGFVSNGIHNNKENLEYDEMSGRAKIAEFLYNEYSLEEVIYQLAKVMFSQSLTHGSEQAQKALQRLTNFLENEGDQGAISPALQKKILDVLLAALSDTLTDHPELLATARAKLGHKFLPIDNSFESLRH